MDVQSLVYLN